MVMCGEGEDVTCGVAVAFLSCLGFSSYAIYFYLPCYLYSFSQSSCFVCVVTAVVFSYNINLSHGSTVLIVFFCGIFIASFIILILRFVIFNSLINLSLM